MFRNLISIALATLILAACQSLKAEAGEILYIDNKLVDCSGVMPQKCMLSRTDKNAEWHNFYDQIDGFEYVAGYRYKLRVKITELENVPADASSRHYQLIEVLEKLSAPVE